MLALGGPFLDHKKCKTTFAKNSNMLVTVLTVSDLAWGKEMLRLNAPRDDIDTVVSRRMMRALARLQDGIEKCVMPGLKSALRAGMKHFQDVVIGVDHTHPEYKAKVAAHKRGGRDLKWNFVETDAALAKLQPKQEYERTAAVFLNYRNFVGDDMDLELNRMFLSDVGMQSL